MILLAMLALLASPAVAQTERFYQDRYCTGMATGLRFPDGTRADCISDTHAIEVDFSEKWAEAIGQALHYALWTEELDLLTGEKKAGIILVCRKSRDTCTNHAVRAARIVWAFDLPVTIWDCHPVDMSLNTCQVVVDRP